MEKVLILRQKALYFPDIEGTGLDEGKKVHTTDMCRGKISVVSFLNTRMSEVRCSAMLLGFIADRACSFTQRDSSGH
jgi:ATPase complex subunit ATP10